MYMLTITARLVLLYLSFSQSGRQVICTTTVIAPIANPLYRTYIETVRQILSNPQDINPLKYHTRWQEAITNVPTSYMRIQELFVRECITRPLHLQSSAESPHMASLLVYASIEHIWKFQFINFFEYTVTLTMYKKTVPDQPVVNLETLHKLFQVITDSVSSYSRLNELNQERWDQLSLKLKELQTMKVDRQLVYAYWQLHSEMNLHLLLLNQLVAEWRQDLARCRKWILQSTSVNTDIIMSVTSRHMLAQTDILVPTTAQFIENILNDPFIKVDSAPLITDPWKDTMAMAILSAKVPSVLRQFCIKYGVNPALERQMLNVSYKTFPDLLATLTYYLQKSENGELADPGRRRLGELCTTNGAEARQIGEAVGSHYKPLLVYMSGVDLTDLYSHWAHIIDQVGLVAVKANGVPMRPNDLDMQSIDVSFKQMYRGYTTVFQIERTAQMTSWLHINTKMWSGLELYYHTRGYLQLPIFLDMENRQLQQYYLAVVQPLATYVPIWRLQLMELATMWNKRFPTSDVLSRITSLPILDGVLLLQKLVSIETVQLQLPYSPAINTVLEASKINRPDWRHGYTTTTISDYGSPSPFVSIAVLRHAILEFKMPGLHGTELAKWFRSVVRSKPNTS